MPDDYLVVARVLGAHGLQGEVTCAVVTDFPERFAEGGRVFAPDASPEGGGRLREYRIQAVRQAEPHVYLRLSGVEDRTAAAALRGVELLVPAEDAVELPEGLFFWHQVVGLRVEDTAGQPLGSVVEILRTGSNDVYVVHGPAGEILVPAIKDVVRSIEPAQGRMVVAPMPGMIPERPSGRSTRRRPARPRHPSQ